MKIGILTFHRTVNDGSVIQNWCLQNILRSLTLGAEVETIDLRDPRREQQEFRRLMSRSPPFIRTRSLRKMFGLRGFVRKNIPLSPSLRTGKIDAARKFIASQGYGAVVSGSDTVWQLSRFGDADPPHLYYQPGFSGFKKIAFAVSADPIRNRSLLSDPRRRDALLTAAADFDFIGVRDNPTIDLLIELGLPRDRLEFMPDPTILYDFSGLMASPSPRVASQSVAGVAISSPELARRVVDALMGRGWAVVNHLGATPSGAQSLPFEDDIGRRLRRFAEQDLLITDRFHSSIFALKLGNAPVVFIENTSKWPTPDSKGRDLFQRLDCADFVWRHGKNVVHELDGFLEKAEGWRANPPCMAERFQALCDNGQSALDSLARVLAGTTS